MALHLRIIIAVAVLFAALDPQNAIAMQACDTTLDDYRQLLDSELRKRAPEKIVATFLAMPSFSPEYGVLLSEVKGSPWVTVVRFTESVWYGAAEEVQPNRFSHVFSSSKVKAQAQQFPISTELSALLRAMLAEGLARVEPDSRIGLDGETYVFNRAEGGCGETWSPEEGTRDALLVKTFEQVAELAGAPTQVLRAAGEQRLLITLKQRQKELGIIK